MTAGRLFFASIVASAATALYVEDVYLPAFNTPRTPVAGVPHARSTVPPAPALARRLLVVITDGLSFERAAALPELAALRGAGTMRGLSVEFPSYTSPSLTSIVTGLGPRDSGIRLNGDELGVPGMDALPFVATDAGVPVRVRSRGWDVFERLVRAEATTSVVRGRVAFEAEAAFDRAAGRDRVPPRDPSGPARALDFFYVEECDTAAHAHGTRSPEYAEAERFTGTLVSRYAARLDLTQDVLAVVSDHGHVAEGGHGGVEPAVTRAYLLVAGPGIARGVELPDRPMRDVASTLAVLAGLTPPSSNIGRPMLDLLPRGGGDAARALAAPFDEASSWLCRLAPSPRCAEAPALLERLERGDPAAIAPSEALLDAVSAGRDRALVEGDARARLLRLVGAAGLTLALALARRRLGALGAVGPPGPPRLAWLPLAYASIYAAVLALEGYGPSFSRMAPATRFFPDVALAGAAASVGSLALAYWVRAPRVAAWWLLAGTLAPFFLLAAWVGADPRALVPPVGGILVFFAAPMVVGAALSAALLPWLSRAPEASRRRACTPLLATSLPSAPADTSRGAPSSS